MCQSNNIQWLTPQQIQNNIINLQSVCFEVTDACNLACRYCVYSDLYLDHDARHDKKMSFEIGKVMIDYLCDIWKNNPLGIISNQTSIGFYGGEPLMNMPFIEQMVNYIESIDVGRKFGYALTTNAVLLDRYMDFFAQHGFNLTISLDGDRGNDAYRVTKNGKESFDIVFANCKKLMKKYPDYFKEKVSFNSVLHNLNDVGTIREFINKEFGKYPSISEVNPRGLDPSKKEEFMAMYKNELESIERTSNVKLVESEMFLEAPRNMSLFSQLVKLSGNVFDDYLDMFKDAPPEDYYRPCGGTCQPFGRKLFVTVNGKILQCERCGQDFSFGTVSREGVDLDMTNVACIFNTLLNKADRMCSKCADRKSCSVCIYSLIDLASEAPKCNYFCTKKQFERWEKDNREYMCENPEVYKQIAETLHVL